MLPLSTTFMNPISAPTYQDPKSCYRPNLAERWGAKMGEPKGQTQGLLHYWGNTPEEDYYREQGIISTKSSYTSPRGLTLFTRSWQPIESKPPRGIVCMVHGYGNDISWSFQGTPIFLAQNGFACFALDLEGHGQSEGLRAYVPKVDDVVSDCVAFFRSVPTLDPKFENLPRFLYGESMGGAICLLIHFQQPDYFKGAVLMAPMCKISDKVKPNWPIPQILTALAKFAPTLAIVPTADLLDKSVKVAEKKIIGAMNPLRYQGKPRLGTVQELLRVTDFVSSKLGDVEIPFIVMHGSADVECSKLYLAITGDSVVLKFEKARCALQDSLKRVEDIVPQAIGGQIAEISGELRGIEFSLDPVDKQTGDEIIALLQQGKNFNSSNDNNELESFHQAASKLGITSSRAALRERRALKKLIERARAEEDKRKESIVAYLLHLMKKYSKLFRSDFSDDNDSQGSTPCSPTVQGSFDDGIMLGRNGCAFDRQLSKLSSFNFKPHFRRSEPAPVPPEELRCPISLQLMYDPVIIASGQTYEKVCIEKWFNDGHRTCPKTQQQLPHLSLTPNYCVKGLVTSWCEQNGVPVPDGPPESLDLNYWRLVLSESESTNPKALENVASCKFKGVKVVPLNENENGTIQEAEGNEESVSTQGDDHEEVHAYEKYRDFLRILEEDNDLMEKCRVVEQIRRLLKDDEEARIYMGANGFVEALLRFLESAVSAKNSVAQEIGAMALFNLAVNNNRNKELMMASGVLQVLQKMTADTESAGSAAALYLNLSCLDDAKPIISTSEAVPFLIQVFKNETQEQGKLDALHALYNIASQPSTIPHLLSAGIIDGLLALMTHPSDHRWTEKCIAVLIFLASNNTAINEIIMAPGLISSLATILDVGEPVEQEQAAALLLILCNASEKCSQMVLQEGVIPPLVSVSVNGTARGKQKAQKLLMLFREQRQRDPSPAPTLPRSDSTPPDARTAEEPKPLPKSSSRRKVGKALTFWKKNKSFSLYQC